MGMRTCPLCGRLVPVVSATRMLSVGVRCDRRFWSPHLPTTDQYGDDDELCRKSNCIITEVIRHV